MYRLILSSIVEQKKSRLTVNMQIAAIAEERERVGLGFECLFSVLVSSNMHAHCA